MTIRKKLYLSFGGLLVVVGILCLINLLAVSREHGARAATQKAIEVSQSSETIRYQMMLNRRWLSNYLLSGANGDASNLNEGMARLQDLIRKAADKTDTDVQRTALSHLSDHERDWEKNFARPMAEKRKQVDAGNATVSELQIQYLQLDPAAWTNKLTAQI